MENESCTVNEAVVSRVSAVAWCRNSHVVNETDELGRGKISLPV